MSRIGLKPITVPAGVDISINGNEITVKGPNGTLSMDKHPNISVSVEDGVVSCSRPNDDKENRALHGLTRALIANMVEGVVNGFKKVLEVNGVGYRAAKQGNTLVLTLGYSHPVNVAEVPGIHIDVPQPNQIIISGPDKQQVGQFAAEVREKRPPEPYKGKGIKYDYETIIRKEGKTGKKK